MDVQNDVRGRAQRYKRSDMIDAMQRERRCASYAFHHARNADRRCWNVPAAPHGFPSSSTRAHAAEDASPKRTGTEREANGWPIATKRIDGHRGWDGDDAMPRPWNERAPAWNRGPFPSRGWNTRERWFENRYGIIMCTWPPISSIFFSISSSVP